MLDPIERNQLGEIYLLKEKRDYRVPLAKRTLTPLLLVCEGGRRYRAVARIKCATTQGRQSRYNPILRGGPREKKTQRGEGATEKTAKYVRQREGERREILSRPCGAGSLSPERYKLRRELVESRKPIPSHFGRLANNAIGNLSAKLNYELC